MMIALGLGTMSILGVSLIAPRASAFADQADDIASMPDAAGKDITVRICSKCHAITTVTKQHRDVEAWTATIKQMLEYGATGADEEFQQILNYLSKYYGPAGTPSAPAPGK